MMEISKKRLEKADIEDRVKLFCGDAASLPFDDSTFNAVFMSFTLELFDTPEIPKVLEQINRVLKPEGRLAVVSISKGNGESIFLRLYEWTHNKWPKYVDCRPIYVEQSLIDAGYQIKSKKKSKYADYLQRSLSPSKQFLGTPFSTANNLLGLYTLANCRGISQ
jgi:demethylmenaquinone methyltransferase/2-methoxy-6-polyprenyl-1,4-benzoquinol methylase